MIHTLHLFPILQEKLSNLLGTLSDEDWNRQTIAGKWTVKDVAVHLLDGNMRALSMLRDNYFGEQPREIKSYADLVAFLNQLNADWVKAMKRLSPKVIINLLDQTGKEYYAFLKTLDLETPATFSVDWAGEKESKNWFHVAREYTEKWHHQQQIRLAVGEEEELFSKELYWPYLETSMRALPHHYRNVEALAGTVVKFVIASRGGGEWLLEKQDTGWIQIPNQNRKPETEIVVPDKIAWRIFTKGIPREVAEKETVIIGQKALGEHFLDMLAVMA